jgi:glycine oxidase
LKPADVLVVGGGIIGLAVARRLAQTGLSVRVLERGRAGAEASTAAAGLILAQAETDPPTGTPAELSAQEAFVHICLRGRELWRGFAASVAEESGSEVTLHMNGAVAVALDDEEAVAVERRVVWQEARGLDALLLTEDWLQNLAPGVVTPTAALFSRDGYFNNQSFLPTLAEAARRAGVDVVENTEVTALITDGDRVTGARTPDTAHLAEHTVLAAGAWSDGLLPAGELRPGVRPARGQILVLDSGIETPTHILCAKGVYLAPRPDGTTLAGSTIQDAGFDKAVPEDAVAHIREGVSKFLPAARRWPMLDSWAGFRPRSADDLPVVGPGRHDGLWFAAGHYRSGLLLAPLTAEWLEQGIVNGALPEEAGPFDPARFEG